MNALKCYLPSSKVDTKMSTYKDMNMEERKNKYRAGDTVYAKVNTSLKLIVRRYVDRVYYCIIHDSPNLKELVYFERELMDNGVKGNQNVAKN